MSNQVPPKGREGRGGGKKQCFPGTHQREELTGKSLRIKGSKGEPNQTQASSSEGSTSLSSEVKGLGSGSAWPNTIWLHATCLSLYLTALILGILAGLSFWQQQGMVRGVARRT
jgi:hypothetical protein